MKSILFLCGAGNPEGVRLSLRINQNNTQWEKILILDDDPAKKGRKILGVEITGPFDLLRNADPVNTEVVNLIAGTTFKRKAAYDRIADFGIPFISLIDPAVDTFGVEFKGDIIIYPNVTFSANAVLNQGSVAFTGSVIGHGCTVGKFSIIAPGAVLNARVKVGDGVYIGTNASILPDLEIGAWATVGMNSAIIQNIPAGATAIGVPAELIVTQQKGIDKNPEGAKENKQQREKCSESYEYIEDNILKIWKELLNTEIINIDDNFFDLGGNSILAVKLFGRLKNELNIKVNLIDIFHYPTINSFIAFLDRQNASEYSVSVDSKRVALFRQRFAKSKKSPEELD